MARKSISTAVSEILDEMQFLHFAFKEGLVNCSGVARFIGPLVEEKTGAPPGMDALIAAVRRYSRAMKNKEESSIASIVKECNAVLRTDLVGLHIKNWHNYSFMEGLSRLVTSEVDWNAGEKVYITQRSGEMYICASAKFLPKIIALATRQPTELAHYQENLSLITIDHPSVGRTTPGVFAFYTNLLTNANINIIEVFSTYRKFSLLLEEKDAPRAYAVISKAIAQNRKLFAHSKPRPVRA